MARLMVATSCSTAHRSTGGALQLVGRVERAASSNRCADTSVRRHHHRCLQWRRHRRRRPRLPMSFAAVGKGRGALGERRRAASRGRLAAWWRDRAIGEPGSAPGSGEGLGRRQRKLSALAKEAAEASMKEEAYKDALKRRRARGDEPDAQGRAAARGVHRARAAAATNAAADGATFEPPRDVSSTIALPCSRDGARRAAVRPAAPATGGGAKPPSLRPASLPRPARHEHPLARAHEPRTCAMWVACTVPWQGTAYTAPAAATSTCAPASRCSADAGECRRRQLARGPARCCRRRGRGRGCRRRSRRQPQPLYHPLRHERVANPVHQVRLRWKLRPLDDHVQRLRRGAPPLLRRHCRRRADRPLLVALLRVHDV